MARPRLGHAIAAAALAVLVALAALELAVRAWMPELPFSEAAHDVLFLVPDPVVGWKHPKDFTFYWNGRNPYCIEFRVQVSTNNFGFRDEDWTLEKPPGTIRIAVLGDSFVEAIQVPLERTSTRQLEMLLDRRLPNARIETMNFGVSNYGVGQYLMVYDEYVRKFRPDYVVAFASYLNFTRTTQRELSSRLQEFYALNVRPSYTVGDDGTLMYLPATDYDKYASGVESLLETHFKGNRTIPVAPIASQLALPHWVLHVLSRKARPSAAPQRRRSNMIFPDLDLNYRILEELYQHVRADGGTLLFADAFEYLERYGVVRGSGALTARNRALMEALDAGYVDLSPALRAAPTNPQFECDMHFNETGNRVMAEALAEWFAATLRTSLTSAPEKRFTGTVGNRTTNEDRGQPSR
jgi:hypothetical protein